jgi:hypothetical protein
MSRAHRNVVVVAFANKLARIAWAVLRRGERFAAPGMPVAEAARTAAALADSATSLRTWG